MRRGCFYGFAHRRREENPFGRWTGIFLMIIGLFILIAFTPFWVWAAMLGLLIALIGFIVWRAGF